MANEYYDDIFAFKLPNGLTAYVEVTDLEGGELEGRFYNQTGNTNYRNEIQDELDAGYTEGMLTGNVGRWEIFSTSC